MREIDVTSLIDGIKSFIVHKKLKTKKKYFFAPNSIQVSIYSNTNLHLETHQDH